MDSAINSENVTRAMIQTWALIIMSNNNHQDEKKYILDRLFGIIAHVKTFDKESLWELTNAAIEKVKNAKTEEEHDALIKEIKELFPNDSYLYQCLLMGVFYIIKADESPDEKAISEAVNIINKMGIPVEDVFVEGLSRYEPQDLLSNKRLNASPEDVARGLVIAWSLVANAKKSLKAKELLYHLINITPSLSKFDSKSLTSIAQNVFTGIQQGKKEGEFIDEIKYLIKEDAYPDILEGIIYIIKTDDKIGIEELCFATAIVLKLKIPIGSVLNAGIRCANNPFLKSLNQDEVVRKPEDVAKGIIYAWALIIYFGKSRSAPDRLLSVLGNLKPIKGAGSYDAMLDYTEYVNGIIDKSKDKEKTVNSLCEEIRKNIDSGAHVNLLGGMFSLMGASCEDGIAPAQINITAKIIDDLKIQSDDIAAAGVLAIALSKQ